MDGPQLYDPSRHSHLLPQLSEILVASSQEHNAALKYLSPFDVPKIDKFWRDADGEEGQREIAGCVVLARDLSETGTFRARIEKLMVSPKHMRKGVAKALMRRVEEVAFAEGKKILQLSTQKDSPAESVYVKLGYVKFGEVPRWIARPMTGDRVGAVYFYKDLEPEVPQQQQQQ